MSASCSRSLAGLLAAAAVLLPPAGANDALAERATGFIERMVAEHGFERSELEGLFADLDVDERVLKLIAPPDRGGRPAVAWSDYRARHINSRIIRGGLRFMRDYSGLLARAEDEFGIPRAIIAAIVGIETRYGSYTGDFSVLRALATLGLAYPPRAGFFASELEQLLLLARERGISPDILQGSYAGAFGMPQFLPSSARRWGVDFDGDGNTDLFSPADAIGSVANFLKQHGWVRNAPVAFSASLLAGARPQDLLGDEIIPRHKAEAFTAAGIAIDFAGTPYEGPMTLIDLDENDEPAVYRAGTRNYYVLTRYNRSNKYAMAVLDLARELDERIK